jgi:hypothetical protein
MATTGGVGAGSGPQVFVSYAHDDEQHKDDVLRLARFLTTRGIRVELDVWNTATRRDWLAWATDRITTADYVLVIASSRYRQVGDGNAVADLHRGVQYETAVLRDRLHGDRRTWLPKLLPIVLPGHTLAELPLFLQPHTASHFLIKTIDDAGLEELLRVLTGQPRDSPPQRGYVPVLPPRSPVGRPQKQGMNGPTEAIQTVRARIPGLFGHSGEVRRLHALLTRPIVIGGGLTAAAGLVWRLIAGAQHGAALALAIVVLGLACTMFGLIPFGGRPARLRFAADDLAYTIAGQESLALAQLLNEIGEPRPANIEFARLPLVHWRADGGHARGSLAEIADYYRDLDRGRLVILGPPGSGKTVLMIQLVVDLLKARATAPPSRTSDLLRVPVRLSLPGFDPFAGNQDLDEIPDHELTRRLSAWIADELVTLGVRRSQARDLVGRGWVLPILDGLDEMDADSALPRRAVAVIRSLNVSARSRSVVLACRRHRYDQLLRTSTVPSASSVSSTSIRPNPTLPIALQDATAVELEPLTPAAVRQYLTHLFPDPTDPDGIEARWRATAYALTSANASGRGSGPLWPDPLAEALCSPWKLYLCRTAFAEQGDPHMELARLSTDDLVDSLLERLIPAAVAQYPDHNGRRYDCQQVTRWLTTLAVHLERSGERDSRPSSDILIHQLWTATGSRAPRYISATAFAILAVLSFLLFALQLSRKTASISEVGTRTLPTALMLPIPVVVLGIVCYYRGVVPTVRLKRISMVGLRNKRWRRHIVRGLRDGLLWGALSGAMVGFLLAYVLAGHPVDGIVFSTANWTVSGLLLGLVVFPPLAIVTNIADALGQTPSFIVTPRQLVRQGIVHDVLMATMFGSLLGGMFSLGDIKIGIDLGLLGLIIMVATALSPWPSYFVATLMLQRRGALPPRPAQFLDWAYAAGLMRLSGIGIQFRHREFQTWLAQLATSTTSGYRAPSQVVRVRSRPRRLLR